MSDIKSCNSGIGGQAVMEGIMMRGGDDYAIAVRTPSGDIVVKKEAYKGIGGENKFFKIPIIRGVVNFIDALVGGVKYLMYSASFFMDDEEIAEKEKIMSSMTDKEKDEYEQKEKKKESAMMTGVMLVAVVLAVVIFMLVPMWISGWMSGFITEKWLLSLIESFIRIAIFILYLVAISRLKDIQRTFMYHGAEHKCINCIEHGLPLTVENVMKSSRQHKRCGTSFLFFVVIVSAIVLMLIRVDDPGTKIAVRIAVIPLVAGISYEIIRWAGRSDNKFVALLSKPGMALQKLTTNEPDEQMAEVGIAAVEAVFDWRDFLKEKFGIICEKPVEETEKSEEEMEKPVEETEKSEEECE